MKLFISIPGIAGLWISLVVPFIGCQRNDGESGSQEDGKWHNDLVALKIRRLERPDRIVPSISMPLTSSGSICGGMVNHPIDYQLISRSSIDPMDQSLTN